MTSRPLPSPVPPAWPTAGAYGQQVPPTRRLPLGVLPLVPGGAPCCPASTCEAPLCPGRASSRSCCSGPPPTSTRCSPRSARSARLSGSAAPRRSRSEEHTSELQLRPYLVCRLLLEKNTAVHAVRLSHSRTAM